MFDFYRHFPWFLKVHRYDNQKQLIADLGDRVSLPAETKVQQLRPRPDRDHAVAVLVSPSRAD
jgi:hypothetical protein